nr:MAG: hypothetical protein DIU75_15000 [Mycolicibacterium hassiacum]
MPDTPRTAGIYCRLSYSPDGSFEAVERQEADCRALADRLAWPIDERHVYRDNGRSAWRRNRKRPGWDAMLEAIKSGQIDAIIVYHGDRLIRQPYDLEQLLSVADSRGVRLASVSGTRNLDSPDDRFILRIEAAHACRESDNTSRRVKRVYEDRARAGKMAAGGRRPFGFERDGHTRREDECAILSEAVDRLLAGQSEYGVIRWLNSVCTTTAGGQWTGRTLRRILESPRIAGLVRRGDQYYRAVWEPIIPPETWHDVLLLLRQRRAEYPYPGRERKHLVSGIAECASGHRVTTAVGGKNGIRVYRCRRPDCPTLVSRSVVLLDAYVSGRVVALLNDPAFLRELDAADPSAAGEIAELERRRAQVAQQLEELVDHPEVDPGVLVRSLANFDRRIQQLRDQAAVSERRRLLRRVAGISRDAWEELPVDVRSSVVRATYRVVLLPTTHRGPGFDPTSVRMERLPLD